MERFSNKNFWNNFSLLLFCSYPAIPNITIRGTVVGLFLVLQLLIYLFKKKQYSELWFLFFITSPFILYFGSLLYTNNINEGLKSIERLMVIFFAPLALYLNRELITKSSIRLTLYSFTLSICILVIYTIYELYINNISPFTGNYYEIRTSLENYSAMHPTYFSLTTSVGFLYTIYELVRQYRIRNMIVLICCSSILLIGLLVAASKMILIATIVASITIISERIPKKYILHIVFLMIILSSLSIFTIPSLKNRFNELGQALTVNSFKESTPDGMRRVIYRNSLLAVKEKPILGAGIGSQQELLDQFYLENNNKEAYKKHFNAHNQYLQTWLTAGIFPFILILSIILVIISVGIINKNRFILSFGILIGLSMLTESILTRQDGIFIFAFFPSFLIYGIWNQIDKKTYINGRFLTQPMTGVQRYATEISEELTNNYLDFTLITNSTTKNSIRLSLLSGILWEQITLPIYLRLIGNPLLLNFCNSAPIMYKNHITTIHDVAFKENSTWFSRKFIVWYNIMIWFTVRNSNRILTVSQFSKNELIKYYPLAKDKIDITYNGTKINDLNVLKENPLIKEAYILCVGTISERKQQFKLIDLFIENPSINKLLVLAGSNNSKVFGSNSELLEKIKNSNRIIFLDAPTDQELANLYINASFSIYLSTYEGFGIPILESINYNTPVIVSNIPVFKELFEDVVYFSKSNNNQHIYGAILEMEKNIAQWKEKTILFKKENNFSFANSAKKISGIINELDKKVPN